MMKCLNLFVILLNVIHYGNCWTQEDMELFDLVENTPQNFYDVLGVDPKASSSEIKKAYRKLSTQYHPDRNKDPNAEELFRRIAAVAEILRNDERRKTYDLILKTGLPDWRAPIYYFRRFKKMGLLEMLIFLSVLLTLGQYLFVWAAYWEKKYNIEEAILPKLMKREKKSKKKGKNTKLDEDAAVSEAMSILQKPRCQDLFPFRLFSFLIYLIKSSPSYLATSVEYLKSKKSVPEESDEEEIQSEFRVRPKKQAKPKVPDYSSISSYNEPDSNISSQAEHIECNKKHKQKWSWDSLTEQQIIDFKKAVKKFPVGTLQRWEKVADFLDCEVSDVVAMIKEMKSQQVSKSIPVSMQGVTGTEKENLGCQLYSEKGGKYFEVADSPGNLSNGSCVNGSLVHRDHSTESETASPEKHWKQEEQRALELALQKYPKDTPARWDKIASFVSTKTKEECIERFKALAQQIKKKKDKTV